MNLDESIRKVVESAIADGHETRYSIAKVAGIEYSSFARWLDEGRDIRLSTASKLADHFGLGLAPTKPAGKGKAGATKRRK